MGEHLSEAALPPGVSVAVVGWGDDALVRLRAEQQRELEEMYGRGDLVDVEANGHEEMLATVALSVDGEVAACGSLRGAAADHPEGHGEIKRMYVRPAYRGRGLSALVLASLERLAVDAGLRRLVLETGLLQAAAVRLYRSAGYRRIPTYGPYVVDPMSVCYAKWLVPGAATRVLVVNGTVGAGKTTVAEVVADLLRERGVPYAWIDVDALRRAHVADHTALYGRVALDLPEPPGASGLTTPARLDRFAETGDDPALAALAFQYGRYLMIAGSRPGTVPLNLQGIWNDAVRPPWSSNFTTNVNLEMNYWPAYPANLGDCAAPLSAFLRRLAASGETVARQLYGTRGWAVHHNTDVWGFAWPVGEGTLDPCHATWPLGGVWLAQSIWEDYAFTGDLDRLRRSWPVLRGAVEFALDWLVPDGRGGVMTSPSTSPENTYLLPDGTSAALTVSSTADITLLRELFLRYLDAVEVLGATADELGARVRAVLARLPRTRVMADGRLAEWPTDVPDAEPNHRHQTHLVGLYPGASLDVDARPDLAAAAHASLAARGPESTGWSLAWRLALFGRLRDAGRAQELVGSFLRPAPVTASQDVSERGGVYPNLLCAHPPFQIDGNFGFVAGVVELLLQSHRGELHLLPCLPRAWPEGRVRGLRARGGIEVDLAWRNGALLDAGLRADRATVVQVRSGATVAHVTIDAGERVHLDERLRARPHGTP